MQRKSYNVCRAHRPQLNDPGGTQAGSNVFFLGRFKKNEPIILTIFNTIFRDYTNYFSNLYLFIKQRVIYTCDKKKE